MTERSCRTCRWEVSGPFGTLSTMCDRCARYKRDGDFIDFWEPRIDMAVVNEVVDEKFHDLLEPSTPPGVPPGSVELRREQPSCGYSSCFHQRPHVYTPGVCDRCLPYCVPCGVRFPASEKDPGRWYRRSK